MNFFNLFFVTGAILAHAFALAEPNVAPFYQQAARIRSQGKLGEVVNQEKIEAGIKGADAWRIAYISSDVNNKYTIATAIVVAPHEMGIDRPIIAWAHGTTGTAQNSGPSQVENPAAPLNQYFLIGGNSYTDYGIPALQKFISAGYVVVATDYQGLGGGGRHQYAVAITNGRDVINSVRAVSSEKLGGAGKTSVALGWSQGGGAILGMASDRDYIAERGTASDDIVFKGFVGLAPYDVGVEIGDKVIDQAAADRIIKDLSNRFSLDMLNFIHYAMLVWGTQAAFPEQLKLTDIFTDEGALVLDDILSNKSVHVAADTVNFTYGANYRSLLRTAPTNTLAWVNAFKKGSVPSLRPVAPVIIYFGTKDTVVPISMGKLYQEQMCETGAPIQRVQLPGEQSHFTTPGAAEPLFVQWIADRLADQPVKNLCIPSVSQ